MLQDELKEALEALAEELKRGRMPVEAASCLLATLMPWPRLVQVSLRSGRMRTALGSASRDKGFPLVESRGCLLQDLAYQDFAEAQDLIERDSPAILLFQ